MDPFAEELQVFAREVSEKYATIHQPFQDIANSFNPKEYKPESYSEPCREPTGKQVKVCKFKYYNKLPLEVRLMIWAECARVPRVVQFGIYNPETREGCFPRRYRSRKECQSCIQIFVHAEGKVPMMLQVNQEARKDGFRYYEKPFVDVLTRCNPYFNFAVDVLHLKSSVAGEVLFGHWNNSTAADPCTCSPVTPAFKDLLSTKLRHLSIEQWETLELLSILDADLAWECCSNFELSFSDMT